MISSCCSLASGLFYPAGKPQFSQEAKVQALRSGDLEEETSPRELAATALALYWRMSHTQNYCAHNKLSEDPKGLKKILPRLLTPASEVILNPPETAFPPSPPSEPLSDPPRGPTAESPFIRLLRLPFLLTSKWVQRATAQMQSRAAFNLAGHCGTGARLAFLRSPCKRDASVLNGSSDLLWKRFSFHILLTKYFVKCFVLTPVNQENRREKNRSRS